MRMILFFQPNGPTEQMTSSLFFKTRVKAGHLLKISYVWKETD